MVAFRGGWLGCERFLQLMPPETRTTARGPEKARVSSLEAADGTNNSQSRSMTMAALSRKPLPGPSTSPKLGGERREAGAVPKGAPGVPCPIRGNLVAMCPRYRHSRGQHPRVVRHSYRCWRSPACFLSRQPKVDVLRVCHPHGHSALTSKNTKRCQLYRTQRTKRHKSRVDSRW